MCYACMNEYKNQYEGAVVVLSRDCFFLFFFLAVHKYWELIQIWQLRQTQYVITERKPTAH